MKKKNVFKNKMRLAAKNARDEVHSNKAEAFSFIARVEEMMSSRRLFVM